MADMGLASRRASEELIRQGKVRVNGQVVTELGTRVRPGTDRISLEEGALEGLRGRRTVLLLHKPPGYATTRDEGEGRIVTQLIASHPLAAALNPVGRLDRDSRGLLLFTNDGVLHYALMDPERHLEKEYAVQVRPAPKEGQLAKMAAGLVIEGQATRPCRTRSLGGDRFSIILTEGRNRQVRKMCAKVGLEVLDLCRIRQGPLELGGLAQGAWRELSASEIAMLDRALDGASPPT